MATDEATNAATAADATAVDASAQELDTFNNDVRLRGLKTICDSLLPMQQKKAHPLFQLRHAAQRIGQPGRAARGDQRVPCARTSSIYPVDSRGLQAVVPGGSARQGSRGGVGAFSGRGVAQQFAQLAAQQETLQTLAADTGGTAFTDSNDFGEAFDKVQKDISSYYILGYASTNTGQDGRFRRIEVQAQAEDRREARAREGYYADRDFTHTAKTDRETQLQEQLMMAIPATDVPLFVTAGYFRLPATTQCPGAAVRDRAAVAGRGFGGRGGRRRRRGPARRSGRPAAVRAAELLLRADLAGRARRRGAARRRTTVTLDVRGFVRDERGTPFATIKDTLTVPPGDARARSRPSRCCIRPARRCRRAAISVKVVVRENTTGQMGTFEAPIAVPELRARRSR